MIFDGPEAEFDRKINPVQKNEQKMKRTLSVLVSIKRQIGINNCMGYKRSKLDKTRNKLDSNIFPFNEVHHNDTITEIKF